MSKQIEQPAKEYDSIFSLLIHIYWALLGNAIAFFTLLAIFSHKGPAFYSTDIIFWCIIATLVLARFIDFRVWGGTTDKGELITFSHFRKYTTIIVFSAFVLWAIVHIINHSFINK
jgi:hypothetical protein